MITAINGHDQQQTKLASLKHTQGDGCVVLWLIVVLVPIVDVLCVAPALQMLHRHNNFFAMVMAINGHDQQQKNLRP